MHQTIELLKKMGKYTEQFIRILEMDPEKRDMEQDFIYVELIECQGEEEELYETVEYLMKDIWIEGEITIKGAHFYLGDHRLTEYEEFEFEIDGTWCRSKVLTIRNEDYIELFGLKPGKDTIKARMRKQEN